MNEHAEDIVWKTIDSDDIWVMDKLILSRKLGYICGPVGLAVPRSSYYIVRPCVNMLGLGLGTKKIWIDQDTTTLPLGYFWCEVFTGRHLSIDYYQGEQKLCVEGFKDHLTFTKWHRWQRTEDRIPLPDLLKPFVEKYSWMNCEFIGNKLIEVHLRRNQDFDGNIDHFIPVWEGETVDPPKGYTYRDYPDIHGRIGAYVR